jgi:AAA family ATP:ADP antiporter
MKSKLIKQFFDIRRDEWPKALLMSAYFFLIIMMFQAMRPMKYGAFLSYYSDRSFDLFGWTMSGPEAEQLAKVLNMLCAYLITIVFTLLVRKFARQYLVLIFCGIISLCLALFSSLITHLSAGTVWSFYIFGDMYNTAMIPLFWAFMNDIVVADEAKRLYGIVGLGAVLGGFLGNVFVRAHVESVGREPLLLFLIIPVVVIAVIGFAVNRIAERGAHAARPLPRASRSNAALEGAKLVLSSKYLLAIAGILACYEIVSNIIAFQLSASVSLFVSGDLEKDAFFSLVGMSVGMVSIFVQLFLTSFVMRKFGVGVALLFLPFSILFGSIGFVLIPTLLFAGIMSVSDNSLNYSINQSAREALYVPTSKDAKYKAKAFIDMFVQRFAKVIAVVLNLTFVAYVSLENVRWLSVAALLVLVVWIMIVRFAGRQFEELA